MSKEDMELLEIFSGEEKPLHPDTVHMTLGGYQKHTGGAENANTIRTEKTAHKPADKPVNESEAVKDAKWQPVKPDPNWLDNLKACAKWAGLFGGLSFLIFYWEQAGLMAESIAVPCIAICTALAGFGCGKNAARGANR